MSFTITLAILETMRRKKFNGVECNYIRDNWDETAHWRPLKQTNKKYFFMTGEFQVQNGGRGCGSVDLSWRKALIQSQGSSPWQDLFFLSVPGKQVQVKVGELSTPVGPTWVKALSQIHPSWSLMGAPSQSPSSPYLIVVRTNCEANIYFPEVPKGRKG